MKYSEQPITGSGFLPVSMQRTYRFEDVQVDPAERTLHVAGKPASVGGRAFDLMLALMARAGEVPDFSRLEATLRETQAAVRASFERVVGRVGAG